MLSDVTAAAAAADRQTRRSSFHAYNLPFLQIIPTVAFLFFFRTDSMDSPDCLPTLLSISVFYFLVFFYVFPLFSCWFRAVYIKLTHVGL